MRIACTGTGKIRILICGIDKRSVNVYNIRNELWLVCYDRKSSGEWRLREWAVGESPRVIAVNAVRERGVKNPKGASSAGAPVIAQSRSCDLQRDLL